VDAGPLSELNQKIVTSAALTHLKTGLTIAAHTGNGLAAMQEIDLLERNGVDPQAFIWVHAQSERDKLMHIDVARRGADGLSLMASTRPRSNDILS
jgi:phosphotriesterase-related protein